MKRILVMFFCLTVLMASFSGCKKTEETSTATSEGTDTTSTTSGSAVEEKKLVEIDYTTPAEYSYWLYATPGDYNQDYNNNPIVKYMNKKFNMTLAFQQPSAGTETDSLNLMMGTGEYTDVIESAYYSGSLTQLFEDGVILDLNQYLDYMPNLKALLASDDTFRKNSFTDEGQLLKLPNILSDEEIMWGGLVYRRDILETMTGGFVAFPSGNEEPTTVADWDYMLPLIKTYFEAAKLADYAPFILPPKGYFDGGDLLTGFGSAPSYYVRNDKVVYGPSEEGYYNYLVKMQEWYAKGYIYKDFAARTNDLFYLPNTALTYGGGAGVWFGLGSQLGSALSLPEYGLNVTVSAIASPIDTDHGITSAPTFLASKKNNMAGGAMVTSSCENPERLLASLDYLYSEEGSYLKGYGLTKEQGATEDTVYVANGLTDGLYSKNSDGTLSFNALTTLAGGKITITDFTDVRMMGLKQNKYLNEQAKEIEKEGSTVWLKYDSIGKMPPIIRTTDEETTFGENQSKMEDYVNAMVLKFILGDEALNDTSWAAFVAQLETYGLNDNLAIQQAAYERYLAR